MSTMNVNQETGTFSGRSAPRFTTWVAFTVFSGITLGASVEVMNADDDPPAAAKWSVACSAITLTLSFVVVVGHLIPITNMLIVGTLVEGVMLLVLTAFWAATVSIITNANNDLGVGLSGGEFSQVTNGNLYYFSWAGFVTSIVLLVNYMRSALGVDVVGQVRQRGARLSLWAAMLATSIVVMGSSSRTNQQDCGQTEEERQQVEANGGNVLPETYCKRAKFGISVGVMSVLCSLAVLGMKLFTTSIPLALEFAMSIFLTIMNGFGVTFITSPKGPGSAIGNLYYFSWASLLCSGVLTADCFGQATGTSDPMDISNNSGGEDNINKIGNSNRNINGHNSGGEIEVETMDPQI